MNNGKPFKKPLLLPQTKAAIFQGVDRIHLLTSLGARGAKPFGNTIRSSCPIHKGEGTNNFILYEDTNWRCESNNCHEEQKQDLISLVMKIKGCSFKESVSVLATYAGVQVDFEQQRRDANIDSIRNTAWANSVNSKQYSKAVEALTDEALVRKLMLNRTTYMTQNRNFPEWVLNDFEVGHDFDWKNLTQYKGLNLAQEERVTFPIRFEGRCVALQGRCISGQGEVDKFPHDPWPRDIKYDTSASFTKAHFFYNYDRAYRYAQELGFVIIVEGVTDVMRLHQYGFKNVVCPLGKHISKTQRKLLIKMGVTKVVLMFDYDAPGILAIESALDCLEHFFDIWQAPLPKKDPEACSSFEIYKSLTIMKRRLHPIPKEKRKELIERLGK